MHRFLLLAAAMCFAGCIVPAATPHCATRPAPAASAKLTGQYCPPNAMCPPTRRYDEVQHPIVNQDGRIEYLPDSVFRSWMFEFDGSKTPRPDPN